MDALSSAVSFCRLKFLLKKDQIYAVKDYLKGRDMVVNLPTGYGRTVLRVVSSYYRQLSWCDEKGAKEYSRFNITTEGRSKIVFISAWYIKYVKHANALCRTYHLDLTYLKNARAGCEVGIFRWPFFHLSLLSVLS